MTHHCHALFCNASCAPAMLMCKSCWALVEPETQREVYRTVKLRGPHADASWAPWWRAQARAVAQNALAHGWFNQTQHDAYVARGDRMARTLARVGDHRPTTF